jgi:hypothetical protein
MIIGYTLMGSTENYYSEWTPRHADAATFTIVTTAIGASTDFDVAIETKNLVDADPASPLATFSTITGTGRAEKRATGIKELFRLRYQVTGAGGFRFVQFDVPPIAWEQN